MKLVLVLTYVSFKWHQKEHVVLTLN